MMMKKKVLLVSIVFVLTIALMNMNQLRRLFANGNEVLIEVQTSAQGQEKANDMLTYTITFENTTDQEIKDIDYAFELPQELSLQKDSVLVQNEQREVTYNEDEHAYHVRMAAAQEQAQASSTIVTPTNPMLSTPEETQETKPATTFQLSPHEKLVMTFQAALNKAPLQGVVTAWMKGKQGDTEIHAKASNEALPVTDTKKPQETTPAAQEDKTQNTQEAAPQPEEATKAKDDSTADKEKQPASNEPKKEEPSSAQPAVTATAAPTNPIKWLVIYKDANGHGAILPIDYIKAAAANSTDIHNTATTFVRNGIHYANGYLMSDLALWTYSTFADQFSQTAGVDAYTDEKGKQLLEHNPYLKNTTELKDYHTSSIYNMPVTPQETYKSDVSFTYPAHWISMHDILTSHSSKVAIYQNGDPLLATYSGMYSYFCSTPGKRELGADKSFDREIFGVRYDGALYDPFYKTTYSYRPAIYIDQLGNLEEGETFTLGATSEARPWRKDPQIVDGDASFQQDSEVIKEPKQGLHVGNVITQNVKNVSYAMGEDLDSRIFQIDAKGEVTLKNATTCPGVYHFHMLVRSSYNADGSLGGGYDCIVLKGTVTIGSKEIGIAKIKENGELGEETLYHNFGEIKKEVTEKAAYQIKFYGQHPMLTDEITALNTFLNEKTTRFIITGQPGAAMVFTDDKWSIGGHDSSEGNIIQNITIQAPEYFQIYMNGNKTWFKDRIRPSNQKMYLFGGSFNLYATDTLEKTDLTVSSGNFYHVNGGGINTTVTKDTHVTVNGTAQVDIVNGGGLATLGKETDGMVQGCAYICVSDHTVVNSIYGCYKNENGEEAHIVYTNGDITTITGNVKNSDITIAGQAQVVIAASGSFNGWRTNANPVKRGYVFGDTTITIQDQANVTHVYGGNALYKKASITNGYLAGDGSLTINVEGAGAPIQIDGINPNYASANLFNRIKGENKVVVNGDGSLISSITHMDRVVIGEKAGVKAALKAIYKPKHVFTKAPALTIANGSSLTLGNESSYVDSLTTQGKGNQLVIGKTTASFPLYVEAGITGDPLDVKTTQAGSVGNVLIQPKHAALEQFQSQDSAMGLAQRKKDLAICYVEEGSKPQVEHIKDGSLVTPKQSDTEKTLSMTLTQEDGDWVYGGFDQNDAYISDTIEESPEWILHGTRPASATAVSISHEGTNYQATAKLMVQEGTCYYLHVRHQHHAHGVYAMDVQGVQASLQKAESVAKGQTVTLTLQDMQVKAEKPYTPSGVKQVAYALKEDNVQALKDSFQEADGFYGITSYDTAETQATYTTTIPQQMVDQIANSKEKLIYLYVKDALGNTRVTPIFLGEYLLDMSVPTTANVVAVKNNHTVIAPDLDVYNYGLHAVKIEGSLQENTGDTTNLQLVHHQDTYANNEIFLQLKKQWNTAFDTLDVLDMKDAQVLGSLSNQRANNQYKMMFTFDGEFSDTIDSSAANAFFIQYHITPDVH